MSFSVSSTRGVTFKAVVCFNVYRAIYMKKLAYFYIGLYSQPGNLGQRSVTISTLFLFISLVTSMHASVSMHACIAIYIHAVLR